MFPYLDEAKTPVISPVIQVLYGAFHRSAWSLTVGWVIFACTQGYGGNKEFGKNIIILGQTFILAYNSPLNRFHRYVFVFDSVLTLEPTKLCCLFGSLCFH